MESSRPCLRPRATAATTRRRRRESRPRRHLPALLYTARNGDSYPRRVRQRRRLRQHRLWRRRLKPAQSVHAHPPDHPLRDFRARHDPVRGLVALGGAGEPPLAVADFRDKLARRLGAARAAEARPLLRRADAIHVVLRRRVDPLSAPRPPPIAYHSPPHDHDVIRGPLKFGIYQWRMIRTTG